MTLRDGTLIGGISAQPSEECPQVFEPGYCLGRAFWGRGYATEALDAVVRELFEAAEMPRLLCCHALANPASGRVMRKAGFVPVHAGVFHKFDGTPVACQCYELTKEQYDTTTNQSRSVCR